MMKDKYPESAGWRDETTSRENAEAIEASGKASSLRKRALAFFQAGGMATADGLAELFGESYRSVQPRVAELRQQGFIEPAGGRGKGSGGGTANVWRLVVPGCACGHPKTHHRHGTGHCLVCECREVHA